MINNGVCDQVCYTSDCSYDGDDCGCAKDCKKSDYGACKDECLVPDCNYDTIDPMRKCPDPYKPTYSQYYQLYKQDFTAK